MQQLVSRRQALIGTAGLAAACCAHGVHGQEAARPLIDVHHHIFPPAYLNARSGEVAARSRGYTQVLEWTPAKSLADMDAGGTQTAVLSMSAPVWFGEVDEARGLARMANEFAAQMGRDHPGRFGYFATLPLPDVEGAVAEAAYALDHLGANGVGLLSNYDNLYLGDARFRPLLEEMNARGTVAYVHPTVAACCQNLVPEIAPAFLELPFDSSRTITSLLYSGALSAFPRIRWIFSHGGGTIPMLADRVSQWALARPDLAARLPNGALAELRRLNFDTASVTNAPALAAMLQLVPPTQVMFGTDYPYVATLPQREELRRNLDDPVALEAIEHASARRLIPGLR